MVENQLLCKLSNFLTNLALVSTRFEDVHLAKSICGRILKLMFSLSLFGHMQYTACDPLISHAFVH